MIVKGDASETKNIVALDYPDAKSMGSSTWTYAKVGHKWIITTIPLEVRFALATDFIGVCQLILYTFLNSQIRPCMTFSNKITPSM